MSSRAFFTGFLSVVLVMGTSHAVWASCGSANCPIDTSSSERRQNGEVTLGYQFEYIEQDEHRIGTRRATFREIRGEHDEEFTVNRIHRLLASVGLTDRLSADLQMPIISRSHAHMTDEDILRSWDISGVGDLSVLTRYAFWKPESRHEPTLSAILGGEFPTGRHHKKNAEGNEAEPGIQPGSNSYDLIVGLSSLQTFSVPMLSGQHGTLPVFSSLLGQFNGAGNDDYRLGDTLNVNLGTSYPLSPKFGLLTQLNFILRDRDGIGRTDQEVRKTGGEFLYFSPGIEFHPSDSWRAFALVQIPVYQRENSIQVVSDYNVLVGASYRFQAWGKNERRK